MPWNSEPPSNSANFERKNTSIMLALKREINHINQDQRYKIWQLDYEKKQFEKTHAVICGKKQKRTKDRERKKKDMHLVTTSLNSCIDRWMTTNFSSNHNTFLREMKKDEESKPILLTEYVKSADDTPSIKNPPSGLILPAIVVNTCEEGSVVSLMSDSDQTKLSDVDHGNFSEDLPSVASTSRKNSCVFSSRKLSIDVPPRLRSTSLPVISTSTRLLTDLHSRRGRSLSMDTPGISRQDVESPQVIQTGRRCSNGVTKSKLILDLSNGLMFRDLDERQDTVTSDQQWDEVRKCRYLRGHEPRL